MLMFLKIHVYLYNRIHQNLGSSPSQTTQVIYVKFSCTQAAMSITTMIHLKVELLPHPNQLDRYELRRELDRFHTSLRGKPFFDRGQPSTLDLSPSDTLPSGTPLDEEEGPFEHFKFIPTLYMEPNRTTSTGVLHYT